MRNRSSEASAALPSVYSQRGTRGGDEMPPSRIVCVECRRHGRFRRHQHRVAQGTGKTVTVNRDNFEGVAMQVPPGGIVSPVVSGTPSCRQGGVRPCQWIRTRSLIWFSTRTRNGSPTSVVIPKVPSGWWIQNTEGNLPFTSMLRRSKRTVGAASPGCARARDATPRAILPTTKPRRDSIGAGYLALCLYKIVPK